MKPGFSPPPARAVACAALVPLAALTQLGCGQSFRAARLTQPVSMSPMADATVSVEAGNIFLTDGILQGGLVDGSALAVELGITNGGREPFKLNAASLSCWLELSPDAPGETLSLTPAGGGEGAFPGGSVLDDLKLGTATIAPGQTARYWVVFHGYRFAGSDVPRRVIVSLPDARGRRVQLVIADPARGQVRWEMKPFASGITYGVQNTALLAPGLTTMAMAAQIARVATAGPLLWDVGITTRFMVETKGRLKSETSTFSGVGVTAHLTVPLLRWGPLHDLRRFGIYGGGEAQILTAIDRPPESGEMMKQPTIYGALSAEGGLELDVGGVRAAATPFPISFTGPSLPRWTIRIGYTHWFVNGLNSGGYTTAIRFAW